MRLRKLPPAMLKITSVQKGPDDLLLIVEGRVLGPWVEELEVAVTQALASATGRVVIDIAAVSYVDADGLMLLQRLRAEGVALQAASPFVHQLLNLSM